MAQTVTMFKNFNEAVYLNRIQHLKLHSICRIQNLFYVMLVVESFVVLLSLVSSANFIKSLPFLTIYYQFVLFLVAGIICQLANILAKTSVLWATLVVLLITSVSAFVVAWVLRSWALTLVETSPLFILQSQLSCLLLAVSLLRLQYLVQQRYQQMLSQIGARLEALQSYIQPHFLFNSLNNLAELIAVDPPRAEELVLSLAKLLRYVMRTDFLVTLAEEIDCAKQYLKIEQARLGDKLTVEWINHNECPQDLEVPIMILQPLLENAIIHGISQLPKGGKISLEFSQSAHSVSLTVSNPMPENHSRSDSHHTAVNNIANRLKLIYADKAHFRYGSHQDAHSGDKIWQCLIRLPLQVADINFAEIKGSDQ